MLGRRSAIVVLLGLACALSACQAWPQRDSQGIDVDGHVQQTNRVGTQLPFPNVHPHRWNRANSGTDYEPCTALSGRDLRTLNVDAGSVKDAAGTDGQTLRGCRWTYLGRQQNEKWRVGQFVGNSISLQADKQSKSAEIDIWLPDAVIRGRVVGVHRLRGDHACDTYVQSRAAAVTTLVTYVGPTPPPPSEICDRALAFTRATISKMPL
ncbi:DUF3558 family protein [Gordonia sp. PS3]|uniref:DUF3558 family protein n=1 Tax=Gordonia sp. PS3 TaxID=3248841 RepID=UPI0035C00545